jgi:hypothetical protein
MNPAELDRILRAGQVEPVIAFFAGATEEQRRPFAAQSIAWFRLLELNQKAHYSDRARALLSPEQLLPNYHELIPAAYAAVLASASLAELKSIGFCWALELEFAGILADRRPAWVGDYIAFLCADERTGLLGGTWRKIRDVVRAGLCPPPSHDNYVLGVLEGVQPYRYMMEKHRCEQAGLPLPVQPTLIDLLLAERDWLETAFWRLFELEGTSRISLANSDKYGHRHGGWIGALVELSGRDVLSRDRLLDASLSALSRDFIQFRAGWFSRLHEALEPTAKERAARIDAYLNLLTSGIPPTVAFAIEAVAAADDFQPLPAARLLPALQPVLTARGKAVVKTALKVVDRIASRESSARSSACQAAVSALLNDAPDVQKAVFALLARHGEKHDETLRDRLNELASAVVASLRPELKSWTADEARPKTNDTTSPAAESTSRNKPASRSTTMAPNPVVSRTDSSRAIAPIASFDELLDRAAAILETPDDPDAVERLLAGLCALCDQRPPDFERRIGPLAQRATKKLTSWQSNPHSDPSLERNLAVVILCWAAEQNVFVAAPHLVGDHSEPYAFIFRRLVAVGDQIAKKKTLPLLSAPTHRGGWIEASTLVQRWLAWQNAGTAPDLHEQVLALLRLAPEGRKEALARAREVKGEAGEALRHALGENAKPGRTPALWLASYRTRQPRGDLPEFERAYPNFGPDAGVGAQYTWQFAATEQAAQIRTFGAFTIATSPSYPARVSRELLPVLFHQKASFGEPASRELTGWLARFWPGNLEPFFVRGLRRLQIAVSWADSRDRETLGVLDPLMSPHAELGPMACLALALGLAAQDATLRSYAQEVLIAAIAEGRANPAELGAALARLLELGENKLVRWSKSLGAVARISALHARLVADLLQRALHANPAHAPRDLGQLLELLVEVLSETGTTVSDSKAREYLAALSGTGKSAKLAKQLLRG